jgi:hypothetical protein
MKDFQKRLEKAIERGQRTGDAREQAEHERAMSEREMRRRHTAYRLKLSEHVESCLREIPDHLPGFQFESLVSDRGWGAAVTRDDITSGPAGRPVSRFSRLEVFVRPLTESFVLELNAKGTVRNKEFFNRTHYQHLDEADLDSFTELVDLWVLEFAELYAAKR